MGLDLLCGRSMIKMGSYSSVHAQRIGFLKAEARRFKSIGMKDHAKRILSCIRGDEIDYAAVQRTLSRMIHQGTFIFVLHSDHDGEWTSGEASAILEAISELRSFLVNMPELRPYMTGNGTYHLEPILRLSSQTGLPILFC